MELCYRIKDEIFFNEMDFYLNCYKLLSKIIEEKNATEIVIVCIGTDRVVYDAIGPFTGYFLENQIKDFLNVHLYGTILDVVNSVNVEQTRKDIYEKYENPIIIAIDSCLSDNYEKYNLCLQDTPVHPGAGVDKKLTPIGDMSILGIIGNKRNIDKLMPRIQTIMYISKIISNAIMYSLNRLYYNDNCIIKTNETKSIEEYNDMKTLLETKIENVMLENQKLKEELNNAYQHTSTSKSKSFFSTLKEIIFD